MYGSTLLVLRAGAWVSNFQKKALHATPLPWVYGASHDIQLYRFKERLDWVKTPLWYSNRHEHIYKVDYLL